MVYLAAIRIRVRRGLEGISKTISLQPQLVACCLLSVLDKNVFQISTFLCFCFLNKNTLDVNHWRNSTYFAEETKQFVNLRNSVDHATGELSIPENILSYGIRININLDIFTYCLKPRRTGILTMTCV